MMIRRMACLAGLIWILWSIPAQAACTGSGTAWSCPAGASVSDVQSAINSASNDAVITFATGSYSWGSQIQFSQSNGVTLICATTPNCVIAASNTVLGLTGYPGSGQTNTNLYRISGFTFNMSAYNFIIWFGSGCGACAGTITQVRVDHNVFNMPAGSGGTSVAFFAGSTTTVGQLFGVMDHNTFNESGNAALFNEIGNTIPPVTSELGTINNMFIEDNTIVSTSLMGSNGGEGWVDGWGGMAIVVRHNTITDTLTTAHGVTHNGGPDNFEFYNNSVIMDVNSNGSGFEGGYRNWHHQGSGSIILFNNSITPCPTSRCPAGGDNASEVLSVANYRGYANGPSIDGNIVACDGSVTNGNSGGFSFSDGNRTPSGSNYGYPCWRQPARDTNGNYKPMYAFNNYWGDTGNLLGIVVPDFGGTVPNGSYPPNNCTTTSSGNCDYLTFQMIANREYYNSVSKSAQSSSSSPFSGTTGMGFGTLANRPTTCTTNATESGAGVGYAAGTTVGTIGASSTEGTASDYVIYTCSATNNWTVYYTPYTYPHPLVQGDPPPPAPPTQLQATVN